MGDTRRSQPPPLPEGLPDRAVRMAEAAGALLRERQGRLLDGEIRRKQRADYVTRADEETEAFLVGEITRRFPDHEVLAEESGLTTGSLDKTFRWVIDPLDGTTNFIHGFPVFAVSLAVAWRDRVLCGVVHDVVRQETFRAVKGQGAFLGRRALSVRTDFATAESLVATGFPFKQRARLEAYLTSFRRIFDEVSDIRRAGSAALDLAWLAAGRLDGFWETGLLPWDMAAGGLLIEEAGGVVTDFAGGRDFLKTGNIVAGNSALHEKLLGCIGSAFEGVVEDRR